MDAVITIVLMVIVFFAGAAAITGMIESVKGFTPMTEYELYGEEGEDGWGRRMMGYSEKAFNKYMNNEPFKPYFQPEFEDGKPPVSVHGIELYSFEVYEDRKKCEEDFPNHKIWTYCEDDIENPTFVDSKEFLD